MMMVIIITKQIIIKTHNDNEIITGIAVFHLFACVARFMNQISIHRYQLPYSGTIFHVQVPVSTIEVPVSHMQVPASAVKAA